MHWLPIFSDTTNSLTISSRLSLYMLKKFHSHFINLSLLASALQISTTVRMPNICAEWLKSCFKPEAMVVNVRASHQILLFLPFNLHIIVSAGRVGFQPHNKIQQRNLKIYMFKKLGWGEMGSIFEGKDNISFTGAT